VVRAAHGQHVQTPGGNTGQTKRELHGLRPGVHEKDRVQWCREARGERLRKLRHDAIEEPRVCVQQPKLPGDRGFNCRVAVAQDRHVVDDIDVRAPGGVDEVVAPAALDARRGVVVVDLDTRENRVAAGQQRGGIVRRGNHKRPSQTQQFSRIRAERLPRAGEGRHRSTRRL